jgi:hypothetical protein
MQRVLLLVLAGLTAVAVVAPAAQAAAPRIVIVSGKPMAHQIAISNWTAIFRIIEPVASASNVKRGLLVGRPRLRLSMFWGPRWVDYLAAGHRAAALRPQDADQQGSFYPAWHGRPAAIDLPWAGSWPRLVPAKALATLKDYGIPVAVS